MYHYRAPQIVLFESNEILIRFLHEIFVLISVFPYVIKMASLECKISLLFQSFVFKIFFIIKEEKLYFSTNKRLKKKMKIESPHIFFKQNKFKTNLKLFKRDPILIQH